MQYSEKTLIYYGVLPSNTPTQTATTTCTPSVTPTNTPSNTNTPSVTPSETCTPSETPSSTVTPTNTPSETVTPSNTRTATPTPTITKTSTPSNTPSVTISPSTTSTVTPTVTPTITPTNTPSFTNTPGLTPTQTITSTPQPTPTPTETPSQTVTNSVTPAVTTTPSNTPTKSVTPSNTPTKSVTPSRSVTPSVTKTQTPTPSNTITSTVTPTASIGQTPTPTPSSTITPTTTPTNTPSLTNTPSNTPSLTPPVTESVTSTPFATPALTPSNTGTPTQTPSNTITPTTTNTITPSQTNTPSNTPSLSNTITPTNTPTKSTTPSNTPQATPSLTVTQTVTPTSTVGTSPTPTPTVGSGGYFYYLPNCTQDALEDVYYRGIVNGVFVKCMAPGDTIVFPAGSATWGASSRPNGGRTWITHPINITGQGDSTVITIDESGPTYTQGVLNLWSTVTLSNMKFIGAQTRPVSPFTTQPYDNRNGQAGGCATGGILYTGGARITNVTYESRGGAGYFLYGGGVESFLIDNCRFSATAGNTELIFVRGPSNAWNLDTTLGGPNNIFVEDCTFAGNGYVNDANSNSRMVIRNCTITGPIKVDGHGVASNTPAESVRNMEVYNNRWTYASPFWVAIEARGGVNMIFNNQSAVNNGRFFLTDYGYLAQWPNFGNQFQTPVNYPIKGQIGVSKNPRVAGGEPSYVWGNRVGNAVWIRTYKTVPQGAIDLYRTQTGIFDITFTETTMISANRDFFAEGGFDTIDTKPGVSIGTKAAMLSTTPAFSGYGFWVTDEGTWNQSLSGGQGKLYKWNGSNWTFYYEPYTYPHPLRNV